MESQEGQLVLCTVDKIEGTTVFVTLSTGEKGTIVTSEIAPGRIRNIRDYVVPNKKVVCKILRASKGNLDLSLRRVTSKEKTELIKKYKQEQTAKSAFHSILKQQSEEIEKQILEKFTSLQDFITKAKEDESLIDQYIPKEFQEQIRKISRKKQKGVEIKKIVTLRCLEDDGIKRIKKIFNTGKDNLKVTYISAGKFQLTLLSEDYKKANQEMEKVEEEIEKSSKQNICEIEILEKK